MKRILLSILALSMITAGAIAQQINATKSKVKFEIDNMMVSSVEGTIGGMMGTVKFDKNNLSSSHFDVTIDPSTIDTDSKKRDEHLQNEDFFNVKKYISIRFTSSSITKKGDQYVTKGKLTMLGTSKEIEIPFTIKEEGGTTTFEGEIEVNRFDYNLASEEYKSSRMVGEVATVKIICVVE